MDDTLVLNKPHYSAFYEPQNTDPLANAIESWC